MQKFLNSFRFALAGIRTLLRTERNFGIHAFALLLVIAAGLFFQLKTWEWAMIILISVLVMALEAINTALEKLCDLVQPDRHPIIKQVKDMAAAGVLIAAIAAVVIALLIFVPKICLLF